MLIFEDKLPVTGRAGIKEEIRAVSVRLGIDPNWLMAVMHFESRLNPGAVNPYSGATGLIQFMPQTAKSFGTTTEALKTMGFAGQLPYVERYYAPYASRIQGFTDLYLATFYPAAMGKPDTYQVGGALVARQNPVFVENGRVTVGSIKKALLSKIPAQYLAYLVKKKV